MHPQENWQIALEKARKSLRCNAKTRNKSNCKSPAMKNGRCRMHGGQSTGAPKGTKHGKYVHGAYTIENQAQIKENNRLFRACKKILQSHEDWN